MHTRRDGIADARWYRLEATARSKILPTRTFCVMHDRSATPCHSQGGLCCFVGLLRPIHLLHQAVRTGVVRLDSAAGAVLGICLRVSLLGRLRRRVLVRVALPALLLVELLLLRRQGLLLLL